MKICGIKKNAIEEINKRVTGKSRKQANKEIKKMVKEGLFFNREIKNTEVKNGKGRFKKVF